MLKKATLVQCLLLTLLVLEHLLSRQIDILYLYAPAVLLGVLLLTVFVLAYKPAQRKRLSTEFVYAGAFICSGGILMVITMIATVDSIHATMEYAQTLWINPVVYLLGVFVGLLLIHMYWCVYKLKEVLSC